MLERSVLAIVASVLAGCGAPPAAVTPTPSAPETVASAAQAPVEPGLGEPGLGESGEAPAPEAPEVEELRVTDSGLGMLDRKLGEGAEAVTGAKIAVHYVGKLEDGRVFDSSRERDRPFRFVVGDEMVIPGWDEGVVGMRIGGVRRLVIPPHLAYGDRGQGVIPGGAILEFEIELLEVESPPEP